MTKIYLAEDGIIYTVYEGALLETDMKKIISETEDLANAVYKKEGAVKILADVTEAGNSSITTRNLGVKWVKSHPYVKIAVVGNSSFVEHVVNFIFAASGISERARYFDSRNTAVMWLLG